MDRPVPFDLAAEEAVLGSVLVDSEWINQLPLTPDDFFSEQGKLIYQSMQNVEVPNQITVAHELARTGNLQLCGGASYLSHLVAILPTSLHADTYAQVVKNCAINRRIIQAGSEIANIGYSNGDPAETIEKCNKLLAGVNKLAVRNTITNSQDAALEAMDRYSCLREEAPGIKTGLDYLDKISGGIYKGEFIILAAESGIGKTTIALQMARHQAAKQNVLFISLEMSREQIIDRNIGSLSGLGAKLLRQGNLSDNSLLRVNGAVDAFSRLNLYLLHGRHTTVTVRAAIEKMLANHGLDIVYIDYLHLLRDKGNSANERIDNISKELASFAKEYRIALIALSQLNRNSRDRATKEPMLNDLRDSGALEHDPDRVWFCTRKPQYLVKQDETNEPKLIVAKDRLSGATGEIIMKWDFSHEQYTAPIELNEAKE